MQDKTKAISHFIIALLFLGTACNKPGSANTDTVKPVITLSSPADNQVFSPGNTIPVQATITDDKYIAEIHIHISDNNTVTLLMDVHRYPAGPQFNLNESITAVAGINYKIQVIARDRGVNESISTVYVSCN